jgi:hypothetical protein
MTLRSVGRVLALALGLIMASSVSESAEAAPRYYQNAILDLPRIDAAKASRYRATVRQRARRGRIGAVSWSPKGDRTQATQVLGRRGKSGRLKKLPLAAVAALAHLSGPRFWGAEIDVLVQVKGKGTFPVTLWFERNGDVTLAVGKRLSGKVLGGFGKRSDAQAIRQLYRTGPIKGAGRRWRDRDLRILDGALALLHPDERRVLKGVKILRAALGRQPLQSGLYSMDSRGRYRLRLFNRAFSAQRLGFAGPTSDPLPRAAWTIIHELGHAVASWPARRAFERGQFRRGKRLQRANSVLKGFKKARGGSRGPTPYGRSSGVESFAESFALFHLDPDALARWNRSVFRWFEAGGHREHLAR